MLFSSENTERMDFINLNSSTLKKEKEKKANVNPLRKSRTSGCMYIYSALAQEDKVEID